MKYTFEYKDNNERESILSANSNLVLVEEQNITLGNFLIFVDTSTAQKRLEEQELNSRVSLINQYLAQDTTNLASVEDAILEIEKNKIINGGI